MKPRVSFQLAICAASLAAITSKRVVKTYTVDEENDIGITGENTSLTVMQATYDLAADAVEGGVAAAHAAKSGNGAQGNPRRGGKAKGGLQDARQVTKETGLGDKIPVDAPAFRVLQFNILAKSLGNNMQPWFMYGAELTEKQRRLVFKRFYARNDAGVFINKGFEKYARDLNLTQRQHIQQRGREVFDWDGTSRRGERLGRYIAGQYADVIILEEVDVFAELFYLIDNYACQLRGLDPPGNNTSIVHPFFATGQVYDGYFAKRGRREDGVAILWNKARFSLNGSQRHEFDDSTNRVMGMVDLEDIQWGKRLLVIGTHLERNPEDASKESVRFEQMLQLLATVRKKAEGVDSVIVAGDMNADALQERETAAYAITRHAMMPAFAEAFEHMLPGHLSNEERCTSRTEARQVWIDYVLYSQHALHVRETSGPELCPPAAIPDHNYPSDHVPMQVVFAWGSGARTASERWKALRKAFQVGKGFRQIKPHPDQPIHMRFRHVFNTLVAQEKARRKIALGLTA